MRHAGVARQVAARYAVSMQHMAHTPPAHRARSPWSRCQRGCLAADATRQPVRQSLARFYPARGKGPRSNAAKARTRALRQARQIKES